MEKQLLRVIVTRLYSCTKFGIFLALSLLSIGLIACSGGSSDSGMLIEGTLIEAGGATHKPTQYKHVQGQKIENVTICALEECSTTDGEGQWGFVVNKSFTGGEVILLVKGHGIEASVTVNIPGHTKEVFLELHHVQGGKIVVADTFNNKDSSESHTGQGHE